MEKKYILKFGVGGGYNDIQYEFFFGTKEDADVESLRLANELAESYGIPENEEEELDRDEYESDEDYYHDVNQNVESWLDCDVLDYTLENLKKIDCVNYKNIMYSEMVASGHEMFEKNKEFEDVSDWTLV